MSVTVDRAWFSAWPKAIWSILVLVLTVGSLAAWVGLGAALCEDDGSPGSNTYCNRGGWEASGAVLGVLVLMSIVLPTVGVMTRHKRLFWFGLFAPILLAAVDVLASATLGTG